ARACLRRAIGSGDPDVAAEGMVDLGCLLCSAGDMTGGRAAFQDAIATGHPTWAPEAMMGLAHWLSMRGGSRRRAGRLPAGDRLGPRRPGRARLVLGGQAALPAGRLQPGEIQLSAADR